MWGKETQLRGVPTLTPSRRQLNSRAIKLVKCLGMSSARSPLQRPLPTKYTVHCLTSNCSHNGLVLGEILPPKGLLDRSPPQSRPLSPRLPLQRIPHKIPTHSSPPTASTLSSRPTNLHPTNPIPALFPRSQSSRRIPLPRWPFR